MLKKCSQVTPKLLLTLAAALALAGCQSLRTAPGREKPGTTAAERSSPTPVFETGVPEADSIPTAESPSDVTATRSTPSMGGKPKIALIFGPGGMRSFAYAGFLQEVHRTQLPVAFIAGLEAGALPAALYAAKPQGFEAEWQMMKLKEENLFKRSLMGGGSAQDLNALKEYFQMVFGNSKIEDAKISFTCLTTQFDKQQLLILNKGNFARAMPFCLSYPPLFRSFEQHRAEASGLSILARNLRQKGATEVIYVDVIGERGRLLPAKSDESDVLVWNLTQSHLASQTGPQNGLVNEVLRIPLSEDITAFSRRRDMIRKGQEAAKRLLPPLLKKYGLD